MKKNGFTMIEIVISIALASIIASMAYNILFFGVQTNNISIDEYDMQSELRIAMDQVNRYIRFASAVFAVQDTSFAPTPSGTPGTVTGLTKGWHYFGVSPDGKQLVHYRYDSDVASATYDTHIIEPVVAGLGDDWDLSMNFSKANATSEDTLLAFEVTGTKNSVEVFNYVSELSALNALQVIDRGDLASKAVALAYRTDSRPEVQKIHAAVATVLDMSGSMNARMNGTGRNDSNPPSDARIRILREKGQLLINTLQNAYVSIVPFSTSGNIPHSSMPSGISNPSNFRSVDNTSEQNTLLNIVNGLTASGATNTGDGIRRAYYQLKNFNASPPSAIAGETVKNYMILLVDGATNSGSVKMWKSGSNWYYSTTDSDLLQDGNLKRDLDLISQGPFVYTHGSNKNSTGLGLIGNPYAGDETPEGKNYVQMVGENLVQAKGAGVQDLDITCFVIGFSSVSTDLVSVGNIATSLGLTVTASDIANNFADHDFIYIASDSTGLQQAFEKIGGLITADLWQVYGP